MIFEDDVAKLVIRSVGSGSRLGPFVEVKLADQSTVKFNGYATFVTGEQYVIPLTGRAREIVLDGHQVVDCAGGVVACLLSIVDGDFQAVVTDITTWFGGQRKGAEEDSAVAFAADFVVQL